MSDSTISPSFIKVGWPPADRDISNLYWSISYDIYIILFLKSVVKIYENLVTFSSETVLDFCKIWPPP